MMAKKQRKERPRDNQDRRYERPQRSADRHDGWLRLRGGWMKMRHRGSKQYEGN
jgi:hypothetical protein